MSDKKFRSVQAFRSFEQRASGAAERTLDADRAASAGVADVSPLRVLAVLRGHPEGLRRAELAAELGAPRAAVDSAVLRLVKEELVRVRQGAGPDEVLVAVVS